MLRKMNNPSIQWLTVLAVVTFSCQKEELIPGGGATQ